MQINIYIVVVVILSFGCSAGDNEYVTSKVEPSQILNKEELTFDSTISLAKEIDHNNNLKCSIFISDTTNSISVCYDSTQLVKINESRNFPLLLNHDSTTVLNKVTLREIYFINDEYTVVIHPKFDSPNAIDNKWNWYRIVLRNGKIVHYASLKLDGYSQGFVKETTGQYQNAQKFLPNYINELKKKHNTTANSLYIL